MSFNFKKVYLFLRREQKTILAVIFALLLFLNALIFYQYVYLTVKKEPELKIEKIEINQEILGKILANIEKRQETLSRVLTTGYPALFR